MTLCLMSMCHMTMCHTNYYIINDCYNVLNNYYYILYYSAIFSKRDIYTTYMTIMGIMTYCLI